MLFWVGRYLTEMRPLLTWHLDGDYGALENLLATEGVLKPQAQKAFLYLCYRQQFLEFIENSKSPKMSSVQDSSSRGIAESIQPIIKTLETARTLPTHPI